MTSMLMFFQSIPTIIDYEHKDDPIMGDMAYFGNKLDLATLKLFNGKEWVPTGLDWLKPQLDMVREQNNE